MSKNLEQWRLSQKDAKGRPISCREAARRLGVQEDVFYRWRTGERFPAPRVWPTIFEGLGIGADDVRKARSVAHAQRRLWHNHEYYTRELKNPPGWDRLMAMIGGDK